MLSLTTRLRNRLVVTALLLAAASPVAFAQTARDDYVNARGLYKSRRYEQAAEAFEQFFKTYPEDRLAKSFARLYYGVTLGELKRYEPARKQLDIFIENNPDDVNLPDMMYRRGEYSYYLRDYKTAEKQLGEFRTKYPDHKLVDWAYLFEAESQLAQQKWKPAREALSALAARKPDKKLQLEADYGLARTYEGEKDLGQAFNFYRKLVKAKDPTMSPRALSRMGTHYLNANDLDDAIKVYSLIIKNYPQNSLVPWAKFNSGLAQFRKKDFAKASDWFQQASQHRTNQPRASMMHAVSLQSERKVPESNAKLRQLIADYPTSALVPEITYHLGFGLRAADKNQEALKTLETVFTKTPDSDFADDAMYYAADVAVRLEDVDKANKLLARLDKEYPAHRYKDRARILAGRILSQGSGKSDLMQAAEKFKTALENAKTPGEKAASIFRLTDTYRKLKDYDKAVAAAEPLVQQVSDGELGRFSGILVLAASSHYNLQQYDDTDRLTTIYLDKFPKGADRQQAHRMRARAAAKSRQTEKADADIAALEALQTPAQQQGFVYEIAEIGYQTGEYNWASGLYQMIASAEGASLRSKALSGLGWANFKQKQYADSRRYFRQLLTDFPDDKEAVISGFMIGKSFELQEQLPEAAKAYEETFRKHLPKDPQPANADLAQRQVIQAGRQATRIYDRLQQFADADRVFSLLTAAFPNSDRLDEFLEAWAVMLYDAGKGDEADKLLKRLLKERPQSDRVPTARLYLAESDMLANRKEKADKELAALEENSNAPTSVRESASFFRVKIADDSGVAADVLTRTQTYLDQYESGEFAPQVRFYRARALYLERKPEDAETLLLSLRDEIRNGPVPAQGWFGRVWVILGQIQLDAKRYEEVRKLAAEMLARADSKTHAHKMHHILGLSHMYQARPDFEQARTEFNRSLSLRSRGDIAAKCQLLIGDTYARQRDYQRAEAAYLRVFTNHKSSAEEAAEALLQAGKCEEQLKKPQDAAKSYDDLITQFPNSRFTAEAKQRLEKLSPTTPSEQSGQ